jgi:hypothetical protein
VSASGRLVLTLALRGADRQRTQLVLVCARLVNVAFNGPQPRMQLPGPLARLRQLTLVATRQQQPAHTTAPIAMNNLLA